MQQFKRIFEFKLHVLQQIDKKLDRKFFCELHGISKSKLSRILSGKTPCSDELFDYMMQEVRISIDLYIN